ncbi:neurochondrin family protein isoform X2 [Wolffia australiana]
MAEGPSTTLDDCLKLLRGERDEQKLAGLLLVTKFFQSDDHAMVLKAYEAVGSRFLDRLLMTGVGKRPLKGKGEDQAAYLRLSVTVLAALCRIPQIASSVDMISKIPLVLEALSDLLDQEICEEIYELLSLIASASEDGFTKLYESGVVKVLASNICILPDGSKSMEMAIQLVQQILGKVPAEQLLTQNKVEISKLLPTIAKQFAVLHTSLKFDALHVLGTILSFKDADVKHSFSRSSQREVWPVYVLTGILDILQNRVVCAEKLRALSLADAMMSIFGEAWLLDYNHQHHDLKRFSVDKCLLLVLETTRVEVAVHLNELAFLKYESGSSSSAEPIHTKQANLALLFSLLEKIIKLICHSSENQGSRVEEKTLLRMIEGLNETTGLVFDFLQDAWDHGERKGDDLLAAVRIIGRYLAEAPSACQDRMRELLGYILSVEGGEEPSPLSTIQFMLPMLCQWTMDIDGCNALASFGGHQRVAEFLARTITHDRRKQDTGEDDGIVLLGCDTLMNILLNREKIRHHVDASHFALLLRPLVLWAECEADRSMMMMASSICSLVFDLTSEEALLDDGHIDSSLIQRLSLLFSSSLQVKVDDVNNLQDLGEIVSSGYRRWSDRFPKLKGLVEDISTGRASV